MFHMLGRCSWNAPNRPINFSDIATRWLDDEHMLSFGACWPLSLVQRNGVKAWAIWHSTPLPWLVVFFSWFVTFYCVWPLTGPEQRTYYILVNRNAYIAAWGYRIIRCNSGSSWGDVGIMLPPHLPNPCLNILIKHLPCEAGDGCPQIIEAWLSKSLRLNQKPKYIIIKCTYMCIYLYIFIFFCTMCFSLHPDSGAFHPVFCWIDGK